MKWLYFRSAAGVAPDNGFISKDSSTNSTLRTSALLKYENLEAIIPFDTDSDEEPNGATTTDYIGVIMIFKSAQAQGVYNDAISTTKLIANDRIYLETTSNSLSTCKGIIEYIERSGNIAIVSDNMNTNEKCPGVLSCKHIEIAINNK
tara:strand:+ start:139 stop:582 length:444 start_codon:yes stop_codon:yes gene_type:complete